MEVISNNLYDIIAEFCVVLPILFALIAIVWLDRTRSKSRQKGKSVTDEPCAFSKQLEADLSLGGPAKVISTWRAMHSREVTSPTALRIVVQAFVDAEPESLVFEICEHMKHRLHLCSLKTVTSLLDIMARAGQPTVMEEFFENMRRHHHIPVSEYINDIFLGGFASTGDITKVNELMSEINSRGRISARGYCLTIKGFLKNNMTDAALDQMKSMHRQGLVVPSFAVTKIVRVASEVETSVPLIDEIEEYSMPLTSLAVAILMKDCQKGRDLKAAFRVEKLARIHKAPLTMNAYDSFLVLCVSHGDAYAFELFKDMQKIGTPSNGLCLGLIARCPESKFCSFADMMADHLRKSNEMSIQAFSALMKVYATCSMYNKACDLYEQIVEHGFEPDSVMYGCLMKFAVECGRTELAQKLSRVAPQLDIQNYMSLIQAAGRDKDIDRAFKVIEDMKVTGVKVDVAAFSCVLDVCVLAGDMQRARDLLVEMKRIGSVDVVAYNILLKGFCNSGDTTSAMALLSEMDAAGIQPNDVSFNSLINASAASGNFHEAWSLIEMMEKRGLKIDNYTMSSLMKVLKRAKYPHSKDVAKAFALLDRSGVNIFCDEILLNGVLETCMRHREMTRLTTIFSGCMKSSHQWSLHTTGLLIKASSTLKRIETCRELWKEMIENRGIVPNDYVLGYQLDALVNNDCVEEAITLMKDWKGKVSPNTYLYSTILKGLANTNQCERAMEVYEEIKSSGVRMNTFVFSILIDTQARLGATDKVSELVQSMKSMGCSPDEATSSAIIKAYVVKGDIDEAFRVFQDMQEDGIACDSVYSTILDGCVRVNRMDLADLVIEGLERNHVKPSNYTLGILMKMYGRRRQVQKAFIVLEQLSKKYGLHPSARVKSCLMCSCLRNNDMQKAYQLFEDIKSSGQGVDAKTYNALIQANTKQGNLAEAVRLVEEACGFGQERVLAPAQTLDSDILEQLLRTLGRQGRTDAVALPLFKKLHASGMNINCRLFNSVVN
jgi:pentatricopeptide repeat protein|mmetsp:Transcript_27399/g.43923  ORF Transcript_27399/g.43923 Transcript_27399/m.43923 type:complete len:1004 (-) Transcript_27399:48-3059(-)